MISGNINTLINTILGNSRTSLVLRQAGFSLLVKGASVCISLLYVRLLIGQLEPDGYGVWITLLSISNWIVLFDVGLGNGLRNKIAEGMAQRRFGLVRSQISTTYFLLTIIFSLVLIIFHVANLSLDWQKILNTKTLSNHDLYWLTTIIFTFLILRFIVQLIGIIFTAIQRPAVNNAIMLAGSALSFVLVFIISNFTKHTNIILLGGIITGIPVLLYLVFSIVAFRWHLRHIRPSLKSIDFNEIRGLASLSFRFFFVQISSIAIFSTSSILITQFYGPDEVTRYQIAFQLFSAVNMVYQLILTPIWSSVTDAYVRADFAWLRLTLRRLIVLSATFSGAVVAIALAADIIYKLWLGSVIDIPLALTVAVASYTVISLFLAPFSAFINGLGKIKLTASLSWLGIIVFFTSAFTFSAFIDSSVSIALALSLTSLIGLIVQPIQVIKILNRSAAGIWAR